MSEPLLEAEDLTIQYRTENGMLTAVSDASFTIESGEYFGLVGESGCGKSTIAKGILGGLDDNGKITSGKVRYKGTEIQDYDEEKFNEELRWEEVSWIPQGSMNSLDPLQRISEQATMIAQVHTDLSKEEAVSRIREMFDIVGLPQERVTDYPHQFSGGMQQRAIIALALFLRPSLLIADEPTTALDVIMQDQVFKYLNEIKQGGDIGMILITHDISLVFESCDRMSVMHAGQVSEVGPVDKIYEEPHHPYTILLKEAFPDIRYPNRELGVIEGNPPQNMGEVDYCTFVDRCPWAVSECDQHAPALEPVDSEGSHPVACVRRDEVLEKYRAENDQTAQVEEER